MREQDHCVFSFNSSELNITDPGSIEAAFQKSFPLDFVINCAAYTAVDRAENEPQQAFLVNAEGVKNLAECCKKWQIPLIHLSTDYVFDGESKTPYLETDAPNPQNVYGVSKLKGERLLAQYWEQHIILRISWVFGRYGHNFVKTISKLAKTRDHLSIINDQHGCPTGASHIANVVLQLLSHPALPQHWGTYHYTDTPPTTWYDFAKAFVPENQCQIEAILSRDYPTRAKRPLHSDLNCDRILRIFGVRQADWRDELPLLSETT
jgi:dTDP-4-dehydrorhamnose reductase